MKWWWLSFICVPIGLHLIDGNFVAIFHFLFWYFAAFSLSGILTLFRFPWHICRVLSVPLICLPLYLLANFFAVPLYSWMFWILGGVGLISLWRSRHDFDFDQLITVEKVLLIVFSLFLVINSFHPPLYWGEKPMDLSLLGYFLRLEMGPLSDPWAYGTKLKYYALGYFSWGSIGKMSGASLEHSYLYSIAMIAGLMSVAVTTLFSKRCWAFSLLLPFFSTLGAWNGFIQGHDLSQMSFFWSATRIFDYQHFSEFPYWSLLFSDLHPHVMAYPIVTLLAALLLQTLSTKPNEVNSLITILCLSLLPWLNAWDLLFFAPLLILVLIFYWRHFANKRFVFLSLLTIISAVSAFYLTQSSGRSGSFSFSSSSGWSGVFLHFSFGLMALVFLNLTQRNIRVRIFSVVLILMIVVTNYLIVMDRINTVFKFYSTMSLFLSVLILYMLNVSKNKWYPYAITFLSLVSALPITISLLSVELFPVKKPSLKGLSFVQYFLPSDAGIIRYLEQIPGTPLVLEIPGRSFDYQASRISAYTGLPTLLGWDQHVVLRGKSWKEVRERKQLVEWFYESPDAFAVYAKLREFGVDYIVVGPAEKTRFNPQNLVKFDTYPDFFKVVKRHFSSTLYKVVTE